MVLGAECPVINQLRLDVGAVTCNLLGGEFVSLFTVRKQNSLSGEEVMRIGTGRPDRCEFVFANVVTRANH
jgi:hypothetical protein